MKICYLGNVMSPIARKLAMHFAADNEVHFFSFDQAVIPRVHVHCFGRHSWNARSKILCLITNYSKLKRMICQLKPDILHAHMVTSYGAIASLVGFQPMVVSAWGSDILYLAQRHWAYRETARWVFNRAKVITASAEVMKEAVIRLGVPKEKIVVHGYGIDMNFFNTKLRGSEKKDKFVVLCTRYFEKPQNVIDFVRSIPLILETISSDRIEFLIIGSGSREREIKKMATDLNLSNTVTFLGAIDHDKMSHYYGLADIYVSPSISDTSHISLMEAMACGVFPVVTDIPANRVWVANNVNGLLVPVRNPMALAEGIIKAIHMKELRERAIAKNVQLIEERGLWENDMKILEAAYGELVQKKEGYFA